VGLLERLGLAPGRAGGVLGRRTALREVLPRAVERAAGALRLRDDLPVLLERSPRLPRPRRSPPACAIARARGGTLPQLGLCDERIFLLLPHFAACRAVATVRKAW